MKYVTKEQAYDLQKIGFNYPVRYVYEKHINEPVIADEPDNYNDHIIHDADRVSAPTVQDAIEYICQYFNVSIIVLQELLPGNWACLIQLKLGEEYYVSPYCKTRLDAQLLGITDALRLIKIMIETIPLGKTL